MTPLMPVTINTPTTLNIYIPNDEALVYSMHKVKFTCPFDGFSTPDWDYIRLIATKTAMAIRNQAFIHPATLVPSELEYAEGYKDRMKILESKMKPMDGYTTHSEKKENYEDPD